MTNAEIILQALRNLGSGWHPSRDVMQQARRDGYQMTTPLARGICRHLYRAGKVHMLVYGGRYSFEAKGN
jgi:predicted trehalose synthase